MKVKYFLHIDSDIDNNGHTHNNYGIKALNDCGEVLSVFTDIFFDKQEATDFVNLCNSEELELIHLSDVIDDILN